MATRHLYIARHGEADAFGELTDAGREQARLLGRRLAPVPVTSVWHSPLPRARATAAEIDTFLSGHPPVEEAHELIDHVPYVPSPEELPPSWVAFFDGYDTDQAATGNDIARSLVDRFTAAPDDGPDLHEVLITHAYPIAWLLRDALDAPAARWLGLSPANAALTTIDYRPGMLPTVAMVNEMSHLPDRLRWTGFPTRPGP